jgi:DNA-binding transcriptional LysR family regulator
MEIGTIDLNLLVPLNALLTERNVTRAAERASVGQPAMSASLSRLRKHFNDPLLVRHERQLVLTALAESLVEPVKNALSAAELVMSRSSTFDPTVEERSFSIQASDYVTLVVLRELIAELAFTAPRLRLNIAQPTTDFADQLRRGQVDFLILPTVSVGEKFPFPSQALFSDRFVIAVDEGNPTVGETITAEQFATTARVTHYGGAHPAVAETQLDRLGMQHQVRVSCQSFVLAPFLIAGTPLLSLMHERLARILAGAARLRIIEPPFDLPPIHEALYWNPRHTDDPAHIWLREEIVAAAEKLDQSLPQGEGLPEAVLVGTR